MFIVAPKVEAFARLLCADCGFVFALVGDPADRIIYRFFFGGLKFKDRISAACPSCKSNSAILEAADYVVPQFVK